VGDATPTKLDARLFALGHFRQKGWLVFSRPGNYAQPAGQVASVGRADNLFQ
jgi:hypothetical protein